MLTSAPLFAPFLTFTNPTPQVVRAPRVGILSPENLLPFRDWKEQRHPDRSVHAGKLTDAFKSHPDARPLGTRWGGRPGSACKQTMKANSVNVSPQNKGSCSGAKKPEEVLVGRGIVSLVQGQTPGACQGASGAEEPGQRDRVVTPPLPPPPRAWVRPQSLGVLLISCGSLSLHAEWLRNNGLQ